MCSYGKGRYPCSLMTHFDLDPQLKVSRGSKVPAFADKPTLLGPTSTARPNETPEAPSETNGKMTI